MQHKESIETQVDILLHEHYFESNMHNLAALAKSFYKDAYVKIPNFAPPLLEIGVRGETFDLLNNHAVRRDMYLKVTSNTPRFMENVRQVNIKRYGQLISAIYHSESLLSFLSAIVGTKVILCPYEEEKFLITRMSKCGDTHGWHWDDYSYSLVWFIEAPSPRFGGTVELIPNTNWDKKDPQVQYYLDNNQVQQREHKTGDVYLIKADTTMHRVAPLTSDAIRIIVNMAWANEADLQKNITHETIAEMYNLN